MADCITEAEYNAYQTATFRVTADVVRSFYDRPFCGTVNILCDRVPDAHLRQMVQCERDIRIGIDTLPLCMTRTHPEVLRQLESKCPEAKARLDELRAQNNMKPASLASTGALWALAAAGAAALVFVGMGVAR